MFYLDFQEVGGIYDDTQNTKYPLLYFLGLLLRHHYSRAQEQLAQVPRGQLLLEH